MEEEETVNTVLPTETNEVTVMTLEETDFHHELISNGKLEARRQADMRFETAEPIAHIYVKNGDRVRKGDRIASLASFRLENQRATALDALEKAKLELQDVLIGQGYMLKDSARVPADILKLAKTQSGYEQARAAYELANYEWNRATLTAPFDGIIANLAQKEYNVASTSEAFCTLIDPQSMEVKGAEYHLWEKIKDKSGKGRRTGVGITAEGDMLAAMGLRYGTQEATDFSVRVHKTLALSAYRSSMEMARERGAFEVFDASRESDNPFLLRIKDADAQLYEDIMKYGRRNIACLTIAPTGTTSLMTQTTSGIEPVFMPVYKRRRKVNPNDTEVHVDFVDEVGDSFEEYIVYHKKFLEWMKVNGYDTEKRYTQEEIDDLVVKSPYYKATANDVDWLMKVKMQGEIQKWVDHSISVTVNLPNDVDEALVNRLYVEAWRSGCKGCTIYRDGSRSGVMISVSKKDKKDDAKDDCPCAHPEVTEVRPKELGCDVVRFQNNKEKWVAFVGLLNGYPYEIFTGLQDDEEGIVLPKTVTKGKIIKQKNDDGHSRYDFQFENKRGYKTTVEGLSEKFNPEYWNYAKLISGVLRYRMPIGNVIKLVGSLQLKSESINTWKNGVERALKKYIVDGTEAKGQTCPVCGGILVYQEGCLICKNCGASRCG